MGLLTGHTTLNIHLYVMKLREDPLCSACGEEEETAVHFLGRCPDRMQDRYSIFGSYLLELDELSKVNPLSLIRFVRTTKRLLCPTVTSGMRTGPNRYDLSAGQLTPVRPEGIR